MGISRRELRKLDDDNPLKKQVIREDKKRINKNTDTDHDQYPVLSNIRPITDMGLQKTFWVTPMGKPRMTKRDKCKKRPKVQRYWEFRDEIGRQKADFRLPNMNFWIIFYIPFPKSYTNKKRHRLHGQIHQLTPDKDNLAKALYDALRDEDKQIGDGRLTKLWEWGNHGRIEIYF